MILEVDVYFVHKITVIAFTKVFAILAFTFGTFHLQEAQLPAFLKLYWDQVVKSPFLATVCSSLLLEYDLL